MGQRISNYENYLTEIFAVVNRWFSCSYNRKLLKTDALNKETAAVSCFSFPVMSDQLISFCGAAFAFTVDHLPLNVNHDIILIIQGFQDRTTSFTDIC